MVPRCSVDPTASLDRARTLLERGFRQVPVAVGDVVLGWAGEREIARVLTGRQRPAVLLEP